MLCKKASLRSKFESCHRWLSYGPHRRSLRRNSLRQIGLKIVEKGFICFSNRKLSSDHRFSYGSMGFSCLNFGVKGRDYVVVEEGYKCIYATAGYPELFLYGVLILSRKMSAWCLSQMLFHSPFIPFHLPSTNVVLVTTTNNLTDKQPD